MWLKTKIWGFFLSVLISGNNVLVKTSSKDDYLIKFLAKYLIALDNRFNEKITFVEGKLENWKSFILLSYDYIFHKKDLYQVLDWIRTDEKTLNSKYPNIKYKINPGNRYGDLPFIEIYN